MELSDSLNIAFTTNQKKRLVPFLATWLIFTMLYMPLFGYPPETLGTAFFKVLPIFSLCIYIFTETKEFNEWTQVESWLSLNQRDQLLIKGLLCSSLGDICLVWREILFVPGLICFAGAHVIYMQAMNVSGEKSRTKSLFILLGLDTFLCIQSGINSYILASLVGMYVALIFTVGWRATARYETEGSKAAMTGCIGALLFILSDFIIAIDKWFFSVPMSSMLIMATYYTAQLGIALSVTRDL